MSFGCYWFELEPSKTPTKNLGLIAGLVRVYTTGCGRKSPPFSECLSCTGHLIRRSGDGLHTAVQEHPLEV